MKNIAVFCRDRKQMDNHIANVFGQIINSCGHSSSIAGGVHYHYMNGFPRVDYIKGIRWDGIIHLPDYVKQLDLLAEVMHNLKEEHKKSKREILIEELESKLAEVKSQLNELKREVN